MATAVRPRPTSMMAATARIFDLSFSQMLWSRRSILLALLVAAPVALALGIRVVSLVAPPSVFRVNGGVIGGDTVFGLMVWLLYIRFVVPVLGVFYGTSLVADEVEDKTITYLFTRAIPRGAVLLGKYLAYLACTVLLILPSLVVVFFLLAPIGQGSIGGSFPQLLADLGILAAGLAAYGAVFALVGARFKRPLVAGLVFVFGWEPWVLFFPGYLKQLTVAHYLQALVPHAMPADSGLAGLLRAFRTVPPASWSLLALGLIVVGALWLAVRTVERREYVLEQ